MTEDKLLLGSTLRNREPLSLGIEGLTGNTCCNIIYHTNFPGEILMKERLSITIDSDLFAKIEKVAKEEKKPRSKIIMEALKIWEQKRIEYLMRKGYGEGAEEDLELAEFDLEAGNEVMD
jgi:hypothetical protein